MRYQVFSNRQADILGALGRGIIPSGGVHFALGAGDIQEKWLSRADYLVARMPMITRGGFKILISLLDFILPVIYLKRLRSVTTLSDTVLERLCQKAEASGAGGKALLLFVKILIFPAFYGTAEAREALGYQERFPNAPDFEGVKQ